jgi:hypothetical protein
MEAERRRPGYNGTVIQVRNDREHKEAMTWLESGYILGVKPIQHE